MRRVSRVSGLILAVAGAFAGAEAPALRTTRSPALRTTRSMAPTAMEDAAQPTTRLALVDQTNGQLPLLYLGSGSCALLASRPDCARQRGTREASLGMALS